MIDFKSGRDYQKMLSCYGVRLVFFFTFCTLWLLLGFDTLRLLVVAGIVFLRRLGQILGLPWLVIPFSFFSAILGATEESLISNVRDTSSGGWTSILGSSSSGANETQLREVSSSPSVNMGEEAGPSNPPRRCPYDHNEVIAGDSIECIQRHLLFKKQPFASHDEVEFARIKAEDLFEFKIDILRKMEVLDQGQGGKGDWMGQQGARVLDNPHTHTTLGEPTLEELGKKKEDLDNHGINSETYKELKRKMIRTVQVPRDENSRT